MKFLKFSLTILAVFFSINSFSSVFALNVCPGVSKAIVWSSLNTIASGCSGSVSGGPGCNISLNGTTGGGPVTVTAPTSGQCTASYSCTNNGQTASASDALVVVNGSSCCGTGSQTSKTLWDGSKCVAPCDAWSGTLTAAQSGTACSYAGNTGSATFPGGSYTMPISGPTGYSGSFPWSCVIDATTGNSVWSPGTPVCTYVDLVASSTSPRAAKVNVPATLTANITNNGNTSTGATSFPNIIQVALADTNGVVSNASIVDLVVNKSNVGAGATVSISATYTFTQARMYYLRACADKPSAASSVSAITESNDDNNCGAWTPIAAILPPANLRATCDAITKVISVNGDGYPDMGGIDYQLRVNDQTANATFQFTQTSGVCNPTMNNGDWCIDSVFSSPLLYANVAPFNVTGVNTDFYEIWAHSLYGGVLSDSTTTPDWIQCGTWCPSMTTQTWKTNCGAPLPAGSSGERISIANTRAGYIGTGEYACQNGTWIPESSAVSTCSASASADLVASKIAPTEVRLGKTLAFQSVIQNIGGSNMVSNFSNKLEIIRGLDANRNATTTPTVISTPTMSGLAMGEKKVFSTDYAFTAIGIHYIRACANYNSSVSESNYSNNCSPWQVISVTSNSGSSGTLTLSAYSCVIPVNQYACNVTATWSTVGASYPRLVTRDSATTTGNILSTTASNATPFTLTAEYNYTNFDLLDFSATLDTKMVTTSCISGSQWDGTKCAGPNLVILPKDVTPVSTMAGTPTTFIATTTNNGYISTPSSFRLFFQMSTAINGGGTITRIGTTTIAALAVGASAAGSKAYTFTADGTFYVRACADKIDENDTLGQITESDENDNCGNWTPVVVTSNCVPQAVNWGSCTGSVSSTVSNGATTVVADSGAPYTGSATYLCTNGTLSVQSGSTCVGRYTVTPSAGTNGTISPNTPQSVVIGNNAVFTVTPSAGYSATVGGTCGGSLSGNTYTTNAISADCTVDATFFMPPPATPTGFTVSPSTCNNFWLNLSWNASPTATSYSIYNSANQLIQTVTSPTVAISINGTSNTSYSYYVKANNAGGQSAKTSTLSATVSDMCHYVCTGTAPTGSGYTTRPATSADGIWSYAASGECTWSCNNYYTQSGNSCSANTCSTASMSNATLCSGDSASVPVAGFTSTVVDSCTATKCEFKCDAGYNVSGGVCVVTPPVTPTGFGVGASSCGNYWINLWWNAVPGATSYDVYRDGGFLLNTSAIAISDPGTSGVEYSYYVVAKNSGGLSSPTATARATVSGVCPCSSQSKTWGGGCSASTGSTVNGATTASINNTAGGFVGNATFSCNGNTNTYTYSSGSCTATYTMTPSAGANGTISPNTPQSVLAGDTRVFTVTPTSGYAASVTGTCGGTLVGNTYTTNPASKNCTVVASFAVGVCPGPLTQTKTFTCDINANGYAAISGSVTRSQSKSAYPTCAFPSTLADMTGANSSYVSDDCVYPTFTVTPSAGANGTISPNTPQTVNAGNTKVFTLAPTAGYTPAVTGTCGGTLSVNTYTTSPITANCTVIASFIPPTGTLTLPASCTIAAGASTCTVVATWVTANVTSPKLIDNNVASTLSTLASSTGFTVWIARPSTSFSLNDGTILLDGPKIVTAECASGSSWNGASNKCEAPSGTLSVSTTTCYMPVGIGSCNVNLTWTTTAPIGLSAVTKNTPATNTPVFIGNNGTASTTSVSGSYPSTSYYLYNNAVQIAPTVTVTPRCASGLYWDTGTTKCSSCGFTGCTGNGGSVSTPLGNLVCVNGRVPPTCLPVPEASISALPIEVSYQGTTTLTWTSLYSDTCIAGGPWSNGTATSGSGLSNGLLTDSTFTFQCIGPGGTSTLASVLVSACPSTAPVLNKSSVCQQRPEASLSLISGNYTPHGKLTLGCQRAESYQLYRQDTVSSAKEAVVGQGGNFGGGPFTSTIDISTSGLYTLECSYVSKDGITFSSFNGSYINYQTKPPDPIVYLYQAPASIAKGSATTISWVVMYPNSVQESRTRACTLTAKPVCTNTCSTEQTEAAQKINDIIETEKTDLTDPKGSRPITATLSARPWGGALNIIPGYDPSDPAFVDDGETDWKAVGKKTFNLDKTTDFKLDCGMPGKNASSTVRVQVTSTTPG